MIAYFLEKVGRWHTHTFWRRWLASQGCICWREGVAGRITVGCH